MPSAGRLEHIETGSLSRRTRDALLKAARSGIFPDGRLPPESELAEQIGVSRTTVRAALQSLEDEGLVSRRRRYGTFIDTQLARTSMRLNRLEPFATLIEQSGHVPSVDPQEHLVRIATAGEIEALRLDDLEECVVVDRVLRADGRPVIGMTDVIPLSRLAVPPDEVSHADSTFAFLEAHGKARVEYATSEFIPRMAQGGVPAHLELEDGVLYIELVELHFDAARTPIAMSTVCIDDSAVRLTIVRRQA
jgi:GntR family transcriptional regulator